ncbi:BT_3928 family protein [Porphyromonas sp.]|uniref:BT_3928 family protein n=1 Tax=Porphyromonas sp. TaxID=1924944 RepID=UPI0026DD9818|nr:BT_3928 family protein [Porphyromonas sp.]MDO4770567.1 DoxX family protein [Porphyromonas sp.]
MKRSIRILVWVSRTVLSLLFIFSGLMKSIDPMGTAIKIEEYFATASLPMTSWFALAIALGLCLFEFGIGISILLGIWRRVTGALATVMMTLMTLLTLYIMVRNPISDCGCFGDAFKISNEATFVKNVILLPLAFILLHYSAYVNPLILFRRGKLAVIGCVLVMANFLFVTVIDLPAIDFRPFKVGTSILEAKEYKEAHKDDPENFRFVYSKGGEEHIFAMNELDQVDSTWVYVRDASNEAAAGVEVTPADFVLSDERGKDVSAQLMRSQSSMFIYCVAKDCETRVFKDKERLKALSELAFNTGGSLYIAMGTPMPEDYDDPLWSFRDISGMYHMDPTIMKTVVRSDPALLIIKDGVLIRKVADRKISRLLDEEEFTSNPFDAEKSIKAVKKSAVMRFIPFGIAALVLLLLIVFKKKNVSTYKPQ